MKIANADKLKKHFENVVDVKLFTVPEICTIIDTFSIDVNDGDLYEFGHDGDAPIMTNLTEKQRQRDIFKDKSVWKMHISFMECKQCSAAVDYSEIRLRRWNYCPNCGSKMTNANAVLEFVGGTKP